MINTVNLEGGKMTVGGGEGAHSVRLRALYIEAGRPPFENPSCIC